MNRVNVNPALLQWARKRAMLGMDDLTHMFKRLPEWESGETQPTLKQVRAFAKAVHVPVGYLFLSEPPGEPDPIPDLRAASGHKHTRQSPDLLEMIYACKIRQSWYRGHVLGIRGTALSFVGSVGTNMSPGEVAQHMRATLGFDVEARRNCPTWPAALRQLIRQAEDAGILVMVSGIVMSNTSRRLNPDEFRGFALSDPFAPLVFVNGADTKAAQMFTLAHELAHIWLGASALSNAGVAPMKGILPEEKWCGAVAAEVLVPLGAIRTEFRQDETLQDELDRLARVFKVSKQVILRRLKDAGLLANKDFDAAWADETNHSNRLPHGGSGGHDFHHATLARVGHRFARALVASALSGQTPFRDAYRMLGIKKAKVFDEMARKLEGL